VCYGCTATQPPSPHTRIFGNVSALKVIQRHIRLDRVARLNSNGSLACPNSCPTVVYDSIQLVWSGLLTCAFCSIYHHNFVMMNSWLKLG